MNHAEMMTAVTEAETTLRMADLAAARVAKLLVGRLSRMGENWQDACTLADLKRELRNFNITTKKWNKP